MSSFRTVKISDPTFEWDQLRFITVKSAHLRGRGDICVFVPRGVDAGNLPIALLLHGVYGSAWAWALNGGAHRIAQQLIDDGKIRPLILAMPSDGLWGDGSGYLPHLSQNFEKWICEDVPVAVRENIPQARHSTTTFISGLSMGGFGALRIGAKHSELFQAISAHSAITSLDQLGLFVEEPLSHYRQEDPADEDVFTLMKENIDRLPPLRFDCGREDMLIEPNRSLHQQLAAEKIPHQYQEFSGGHDWEYWREHLVDSLLFFDACPGV